LLTKKRGRKAAGQHVLIKAEPKYLLLLHITNNG